MATYSWFASCFFASNFLFRILRTQGLAVELADYLAKRLEQFCAEEATAARVLRELVKNQRLG